MAAQSNGAFAPIVFSFQSTYIRTFIDDNGEPWFCANDVCEILGYVNSRQAVQKNCREKGVSKRDTLTEGGKQELTFINEGNLYRLIIRSKKPEAEKFEEMVMDEILPTIRKTGSYHSKPVLPNLEARLQKLEEKYQPINPPTWTRPGPPHEKGADRSIDASRKIITELKVWANTLPHDIGSPLWDALDDLANLLIAGWTEVDEALLHISVGANYLKRWMGRG
jgi:prophage antirepressor-like protein